ncbi:hypothetical protein GCM10011344_32190 [Dokdonia pacifica]|uniref:Uncharacterized protein n=1 Tax=Dokdonia pacifica TaxID=1627892 RepID=A0A239BJP2_9FLAO|nr:hypothetical protein [Dokdonia pacifica]GGG28917.1 hypothetical protein GCM10011344_32190 [Dokdonia pacifica]SNS08365.1 hypothetical protein SAMN06265376_106248 [Dokdonia pacifica]
MSIWIGKDTDNNVRAQLDFQPENGHLGLAWEEVAVYENPDPKHLLKTLVVPSQYDKEITAINYVTELQSGIRLVEDVTLTNDGLVKETIYSYKDGEEKRPVVMVSEKYEYRNTDLEFYPAERGMYSREKKWQYYFENGMLDTNEENTKVRYKIYETNRQILEVGLKRRTNITRVLSEKVGAILVILGIFVDDENSTAKKKAYDELRKLSREFSTDFTEYKSYATTELYGLIETESSLPWLSAFVPTKEQLIGSGKTEEEATVFQSYIDALELNDMQGNTIRHYFIEKLKGNVR